MSHTTLIACLPPVAGCAHAPLGWRAAAHSSGHARRAADSASRHAGCVSQSAWVVGAGTPSMQQLLARHHQQLVTNLRYLQQAMPTLRHAAPESAPLNPHSQRRGHHC